MAPVPFARLAAKRLYPSITRQVLTPGRIHAARAFSTTGLRRAEAVYEKTVMQEQHPPREEYGFQSQMKHIPLSSQ